MDFIIAFGIVVAYFWIMTKMTNWNDMPPDHRHTPGSQDPPQNHK